MPRCNKDREEIKVNPTSEGFQDNEEVYYCEVTKEIFRDYDEYFRRIMLINSTMWTCEITGTENLTYTEALKSEKKAIEKGNGLREILKAPILLLCKLTEQASYYEFGRLLFQFFKEQYLIGEIVIRADLLQARYKYEVVGVIKNKELSTPNSTQSANTTSTETKIAHNKYKIKSTSKRNSDKILTLSADQIKRLKIDYSYDRLMCFLKENTVIIDGRICPKESVFKKYVIDRKITFQNLFVCELPKWKTKKKFNNEKKDKIENHNEKVKKQKAENNHKDKKQSSTIEKDKNQKSISQYLVKSKNGEADNTENKKNLMIEMERIRKEREAKQLELERKRAELNAKAEKEVTRVLTKCDDLERDDQKVLPMYKPVKSIVSNKYFGDLLMIQEFLHSFSHILLTRDVFPNNVTYHQMCRSLTVREIAGPLSDILQILLSTIFSLQIEENEECDIEYREPARTMTTNEPQLTISRATKTHYFVSKHYSHKIYELPIDAFTLTELLRLHFLSSGAETTEKSTKWRYMYRNGYSNTEDPGLLLRIKQPHILRALKMYSIYQLPTDDIVKILKCLIDQILTYQSTISLLEERTEKITKLQQEIRNICIEKNRRTSTNTNKKKQLKNEYNLKALETQDVEEKRKIMNDLDVKIAKIVTEDDKGEQDFEYKLLQARSELFDYVINLGSDRCYRQYYIFESIYGLFIEHPVNTLDDKCLDNPPENCMELTNLLHIKGKLKTFFVQHLKEMEKENSKTYDKMNSNKGNKENSRINGILKKNLIATVPTTEVASATTPAPMVSVDGVKLVEYGPQPYNPSQYELYMCTGDPNNCIVHNEKDPNRYQWSYIHTEEDLEELIGALNPLGRRESALKENLDIYKSLIIKHIRNCPVNDLSLGDNEKNTEEKFMNQMKIDKKYLNSNFGFNSNTDISDIMYNVLLDRILQLESDISKGHLGKLKVKDVERWRSDLQNNAYDSQCKNLMYGMKNDSPVNEFDDPGNDLGNTTEIKSEDSSNSDEDELPLYDSPQLRKTVEHLASALLQIEQGIEQKFLKEPFGVKNELKDKEAHEARMALGRTRLKNWESSLLKSTSYSQIFLHLNVLSDAVKWTKSSSYARCTKCRKKSVPDQMLLCDECNAGMHMFCMEPKLTSIPKGNWYCVKCTDKLGKNKTEKSKRQTKVFKMNDDDNDSNDDDDDSDDDNDDSEDSDGESEEDEEEEDEAGEEEQDEEEKEEEDSSDEDEDEEDSSDTEKNTPTRRSTRIKQRKSRTSSNDGTIDTEDNASEKMTTTGRSLPKYVNRSEDEETDSGENKTCKECLFNDADISCNTCNSWYHLECTDIRRFPRGNWECTKCKQKLKQTKNGKRKVEQELSNDSSYSEENEERFAKRSKYNTSTSPTRNLRKRNNNENNKNAAGVASRRLRHKIDNSLPLNNALLYELLDGIMNHQDAWPFVRPVLRSQVPDYYDVITKPMDFGRIKSNLNMGKYRENKNVINDIELVFRNCDLYNTQGNEVYRAGKSLERFVHKKCKELKLPFKPSDMISNEINGY